MKNVKNVIALVTLFALLYQLSPYIGFSDNTVLVMFILSPFLILYMAFVILKYGKPSGRTFDERLYDDIDNVN